MFYEARALDPKSATTERSSPPTLERPDARGSAGTRITGFRCNAGKSRWLRSGTQAARQADGAIRWTCRHGIISFDLCGPEQQQPSVGR